MATMKAVICTKYGPPEVLRIAQLGDRCGIAVTNRRQRSPQPLRTRMA